MNDGPRYSPEMVEANRRTLEAHGAPTGKSDPDAGHDAITRHVERLDLAELLSEPDEPIRWVWGEGEQGYLERGTVACLHGFGGIGKSLLTGALAIAHENGTSLLDQPCAPGGRVLIVDAENPRREIKRRVRRLALDAEQTRYLRASAPILTDGFGVWLTQEILDHRATLVVLDSQRGLYPGDEREAIEMRLLYTALRHVAEKTDAAILVVHHDNRGRDFSGSTDIDASVDSRMHLTREQKDEEIVYLAQPKCRAAKALPTIQIAIELDADRLHVTSKGERQPTKRPSIATETKKAEILTAIDGADGPVTRAQVARAIAIDPKHTTFRRAWNLLLADNGAISEVAPGLFSRPRAAGGSQGAISKEMDGTRHLGTPGSAMTPMAPDGTPHIGDPEASTEGEK